MCKHFVVTWRKTRDDSIPSYAATIRGNTACQNQWFTILPSQWGRHFTILYLPIVCMKKSLTLVTGTPAAPSSIPNSTMISSISCVDIWSWAPIRFNRFSTSWTVINPSWFSSVALSINFTTREGTSSLKLMSTNSHFIETIKTIPVIFQPY